MRLSTSHDVVNSTNRGLKCDVVWRALLTHPYREVRLRRHRTVARCRLGARGRRRRALSLVRAGFSFLGFGRVAIRQRARLRAAAGVRLRAQPVRQRLSVRPSASMNTPLFGNISILHGIELGETTILDVNDTRPQVQETEAEEEEKD